MSISNAIAIWTIAVTVCLPLLVLALSALVARTGNITQRSSWTAGSADFFGDWGHEGPEYAAAATRYEMAFFGPMLRDPATGRYVSRLMSCFQGDAVDRSAVALASYDTRYMVDHRGVYMGLAEMMDEHDVAGWSPGTVSLAHCSGVLSLAHVAREIHATNYVNVGPSLYRDLLDGWELYGLAGPVDWYQEDRDTLAVCVEAAGDGSPRILAVS